MKGLSTIGRRYGYRPDLPDIRDHALAFAGDPSVLPTSVSMAAWEPPIMDQGQLGSCTGNAISMALKVWMTKNAYRWPFTPSRLQIYYDERALEGSTQQDAGAIIRDGFKVVNQKGTCPEDSDPKWSWPYSSTDDRWKEQPPPPCYADAQLHRCLKYERVAQDRESIMAALGAGKPMVIGIAVFQSFEHQDVAKSGVVPMPHFWEVQLGGHALCLDGYGNHDADHVDGPNSWSPNWGDQGHYHLPWRYLLDPRLTSDLWAVSLIT